MITPPDTKTMKKIFRSSLLLMLISIFTTAASAQQNEIKKRPIKKQDFGVKEYMVDGIKVISKPSTKDIISVALYAVSYTHLRAHETVLDLVCRLLLENKKKHKKTTNKTKQTKLVHTNYDIEHPQHHTAAVT